MSELKESDNLNSVVFLSRISTLIQTVADNLRDNRLDRRAIQKLLLEYSARAESDGRLINASRQSPQCVEHGIFLAYSHVELLTWLARNNYTIPATTVRWYSWRKLVSSKYRLPLFSVSSQALQLQDQLSNIVVKAGLLYTDLRENQVEIPPVAIDYRTVTPCKSQGTPPEALHDLLRRGRQAEQQIYGGRVL